MSPGVSAVHGTQFWGLQWLTLDHFNREGSRVGKSYEMQMDLSLVSA